MWAHCSFGLSKRQKGKSSGSLPSWHGYRRHGSFPDLWIGHLTTSAWRSGRSGHHRDTSNASDVFESLEKNPNPELIIRPCVAMCHSCKDIVLFWERNSTSVLWWNWYCETWSLLFLTNESPKNIGGKNYVWNFGLDFFGVKVLGTSLQILLRYNFLPNIGYLLLSRYLQLKSSLAVPFLYY